MGNVDTTRREVDRHEEKAEPHHDRPQPGNGVTENADGSWDVETKTTDEVQNDALVHSEGYAPGFLG